MSTQPPEDIAKALLDACLDAEPLEDIKEDFGLGYQDLAVGCYYGASLNLIATAIREAVEAETLRIMTILQGAAEYAESQAETGPIRDEMATHAAALRIVENRVRLTQNIAPTSIAIRSRSEKP